MSAKKMNANKIFNEIWSYHDLHQEIAKYFNEGFNFGPNKEKEELFFIDVKWIKDWKKYSRYGDIITKERDYNVLEQIGYLNYSEYHNLGNFKTGDSFSNFLSNTVNKIEDFDCLVNKETFDSFKRYKTKKNILDGFYQELDFQKIDCYFYEKMLVLITQNKNRIILYSKFFKNPHDELIQLSLNLPKFINLNKESPDLVKDVINFFFGNENDTDYSFVFHEKYLESKEKRNNLIKFLTNDLKIDVNPENVIKLRKKDFIIRNNNLCRKDIVSVDNSDKLLLLLNNSNSPRLIGLQNIGATCYMNATL